MQGGGGGGGWRGVLRRMERGRGRKETMIWREGGEGNKGDRSTKRRGRELNEAEFGHSVYSKADLLPLLP